MIAAAHFPIPDPALATSNREIAPETAAAPGLGPGQAGPGWVVAEIELTAGSGRRGPAFLFGPVPGDPRGDVETRRAVIAAGAGLFPDAAIHIRRFYAPEDAPPWRLRAAPKVHSGDPA